MMFRRKPSPVPDQIEVETSAYARWLRAQRPHFGSDGLSFFRLPQAMQEAFAAEGDKYLLSCLDLGAETAEEHGSQITDDAKRAEDIVARMVRERLGAQNGPSVMPQSMGGLGKRRAAAEAQKPVPSFLGMEPDGVGAPEGDQGHLDEEAAG